MIVIDRFKPVTLAHAQFIIPVLSSFVSVRTRANGNALARAGANVPVVIRATVLCLSNAHAAATSNIPVEILRAWQGDAVTAASFRVPEMFIVTSLG